MKKVLLTTALIFSLISPSITFAETGSSTSGTSATLDTTALDCMIAAVTTRQTTVHDAYTVYAAAVADLYMTADDLAALKADAATSSDVKAYFKAYWKSYKETMKTAKDTLNKAKKSAWTTFRNSMRSCKGVPSDSSYQSSDASN